MIGIKASQQERKLRPWGKRELQKLKAIETNLPDRSGPNLRNLKRLMTRTDRRSVELARMSRELCSIIRSVSPGMKSDLLGRAVARLLDILYYADDLSANLKKIIRIEGRCRRDHIRSVLLEIQNVSLEGQRRQVEGLRLDIPLMLKQLKSRKAYKRKPN